MKFEKKFPKKIHRKIRQSFGSFFSFLVAGILGGIGFFVVGSSLVAAGDLLDEAFEPAMQQNFLLNLGNTKSEVGAAVFRETRVLGPQGSLNDFCQLGGQQIFFDDPGFRQQFCQARFGVNFDEGDSCAGGNPIEDDEYRGFCEAIGGVVETMWGDRFPDPRPPLVIRIVRLILRMTVVLAVTMLIFLGIRWALAAQDEGEIKNIQQKILWVVIGLVIALASVVIVELASSISFGTFTELVELNF